MRKKWIADRYIIIHQMCIKYVFILPVLGYNYSYYTLATNSDIAYSKLRTKGSGITKSLFGGGGGKGGPDVCLGAKKMASQ